MKNKPYLIDVDGVIADFHEPVVDYIKERWGITVNRDDVTTDIRKYADDNWDDEAENYVKSPGFAQRLKPLPGAIDAVRSLMEEHEVVFVTAPYLGSMTWDYDRRAWLEHHFNINKHQLIFAHNKKLVIGKTLIDDKFENIIDWSDYHKATGILFQQPWNKIRWENLNSETFYGLQWIKYKNKEKFGDFFVCQNWDDVLTVIKAYK